jgi:Amt family ammonium transporter
MASLQLSEAQMSAIVASVTNTLEASIQEELGTTLLKLDVRKADAIFFMLCATLVFIMQVGFALLEVGSVSVKNTKNILLKNIMDLCVSAISFYLIGYGFGYG